MALLEHDILRILMHSRDRIAAAAWIVVRDGQASEDIFQNVAIKAMTKQVCFEAIQIDLGTTTKFCRENVFLISYT